MWNPENSVPVLFTCVFLFYVTIYSRGKDLVNLNGEQNVKSNGEGKTTGWESSCKGEMDCHEMSSVGTGASKDPNHDIRCRDHAFQKRDLISHDERSRGFTTRMHQKLRREYLGEQMRTACSCTPDMEKQENLIS